VRPAICGLEATVIDPVSDALAGILLRSRAAGR
jgi:hypothetical protein